MRKIFNVLLGVITSTGGFVEVGSISTSAQAGSEFGFSLLWAIAAATLFLAALAEMAGRGAALSTHSVAAAVRERFGFQFQMVGREVHTADNRRLGRLEEFRAERRGDEWVITTFVIGEAGLLERLGLGVRAILGVKRPGGYLIRWDQMDLTNPERPRLYCAVEELERA